LYPDLIMDVLLLTFIASKHFRFMNWYSIKAFFNFWLSSKTIYDIHSPTVYEFLQFTLDPNRTYYDFAYFDQIRYRIKQEETLLPSSHYGAGSKVSSKAQPIKKIVRHTLSPPKVSEQLYRINLFLNTENCLELGTCLGLNSMYLAKSCSGRLTTIEGHSPYYKYAQQLFRSQKLENVDLMEGAFTACLEKLPDGQYDMIYIDGDHTYDSTLQIVDMCQRLIKPNGLILVSDIYWNKEMSLAWKELQSLPAFPLSIDLFHAGILWGSGWKISKKHIPFSTLHWTKPWKYLHGI